MAQIILCLLFAVEIGFSIAKHGEERKGKYSIWLTLITIGWLIGLLIWGGFFDNII
jgi:hypothetical protein